MSRMPIKASPRTSETIPQMTRTTAMSHRMNSMHGLFPPIVNGKHEARTSALKFYDRTRDARPTAEQDNGRIVT